jgi:hypothetical protein
MSLDPCMIMPDDFSPAFKKFVCIQTIFLRRSFERGRRGLPKKFRFSFFGPPPIPHGRRARARPLRREIHASGLACAACCPHVTRLPQPRKDAPSGGGANLLFAAECRNSVHQVGVVAKACCLEHGRSSLTSTSPLLLRGNGRLPTPPGPFSTGRGRGCGCTPRWKGVGSRRKSVGGLLEPPFQPPKAAKGAPLCVNWHPWASAP